MINIYKSWYDYKECVITLYAYMVEVIGSYSVANFLRVEITEMCSLA